MLSKEVKEEIRRMVLESNIFADLAEQEINDKEPLHLDSMSLMWLIAGLEERFGFEINFREIDLQHFETIESIQKYADSIMEG